MSYFNFATGCDRPIWSHCDRQDNRADFFEWWAMNWRCIWRRAFRAAGRPPMQEWSEESHDNVPRKGERVGRNWRGLRATCGQRDEVSRGRGTGPGPSLPWRKSGVRSKVAVFTTYMETGDCLISSIQAAIQAAKLIDELEVSLYQDASPRSADDGVALDTSCPCARRKGTVSVERRGERSAEIERETERQRERHQL
ncbi:hypothetical protein F4678DRAFT_4114 [Xylaria arbuscula]|nr:hypothetical protein F4678DRAFT_4114 [Xylaria arbuscula]